MNEQLNTNEIPASETEQKKEFANGISPTKHDFTVYEEKTEREEVDGELVEVTKKVPVLKNTLPGTDKKGNPLRYVLLSDDRIACVKEGKGRDAEKATMESAGDKEKYLSSLVAATTVINGSAISMYDLTGLKLKDYTAIQVAFAEINF